MNLELVLIYTYYIYIFCNTKKYRHFVLHIFKILSFKLENLVGILVIMFEFFEVSVYILISILNITRTTLIYKTKEKI